MIVQKLHLYKKKNEPTTYLKQTATDEEVAEEVKRADSLDIKIGDRYRTKFNFLLTIESLGRPTKMQTLYITRGKPTIVQCKQSGTSGTYPTQYTIEEILEMTPL